MARDVAHLLTIFGHDEDAWPLFMLECRDVPGYDMACGAWEECGCDDDLADEPCPKSPNFRHDLTEVGLSMPTGTCWMRDWDGLEEAIQAFAQTTQQAGQEYRGVWAVRFDMGEPEYPKVEALAMLSPGLRFRRRQIVQGDPKACVRFPLAGLEITLQEAIEDTVFIELDEDGDIEVDASASVAVILPLIREK